MYKDLKEVYLKNLFCFFHTGGFRVILLAQAKEMHLRGYVAIPGCKLCPPC